MTVRPRHCHGPGVATTATSTTPCSGPSRTTFASSPDLQPRKGRLVTAQTPPQDHRLSGPPQRRRATRTAIGRAQARHRTYLIATCIALVLAAIGDEAPGYDGPGPFIDLALAVAMALSPRRFTPLFVAAASAFFLYGGLATPAFAHRLAQPDQILDFTAGWLQMLSFAIATTFAVASFIHARRTTPTL